MVAPPAVGRVKSGAGVPGCSPFLGLGMKSFAFGVVARGMSAPSRRQCSTGAIRRAIRGGVTYRRRGTPNDRASLLLIMLICVIIIRREWVCVVGPRKEPTDGDSRARPRAGERALRAGVRSGRSGDAAREEAGGAD